MADVAICGERGALLRFAGRGREITCPACKVKHDDPERQRRNIARFKLMQKRRPKSPFSVY